MSDTERMSQEIKVNCQPTEMGIRLDIHCQEINLTIEFDPHADPLMMHSLLACVPEFIIHALEKITSDDSPWTAREWWESGAERLGSVTAHHVDI